MSSSAPGPQDPSNLPQPTPAEGHEKPGREADRSLLEKVIRQTAELCDSSEPLDRGSAKALRKVARRHRGQPLAVEPVGVELVEAVLEGQFPPGSTAPKLRRAMSIRIAETLLEDPVASSRLRKLWSRLSGEAP